MMGAHKNLNVQGNTNKAVKAVMSGVLTPAELNRVGKAHHKNPIGAPSLK
jgi:hypothetical protein